MEDNSKSIEHNLNKLFQKMVIEKYPEYFTQSDFSVSYVDDDEDSTNPYYAIFLEKLRIERKIIDFKHEPKCFWFEGIKRGVRSYLPDFCVLHLSGNEEWAEVKGYYDSKSQTKMKRMAKYYPNVKIRLVGAEWFKQNLKACKALEPLLVRKKFEK